MRTIFEKEKMFYGNPRMTRINANRIVAAQLRLHSFRPLAPIRVIRGQTIFVAASAFARAPKLRRRSLPRCALPSARLMTGRASVLTNAGQNSAEFALRELAIAV